MSKSAIFSLLACLMCIAFVLFPEPIKTFGLAVSIGWIVIAFLLFAAAIAIGGIEGPNRRS